MKSIIQKMLLFDIYEKSNSFKRKRFCVVVRLMIVFGLGLSVGTSLKAQEECGTVFTEQMKQDIIKKVEEAKKKNKKSNQTLVFKVKPYIMRTTSLATAIDPSILSAKEADLNAAFADTNIQFDFFPHNFLTCNSTYNIEGDEFDNEAS